MEVSGYSLHHIYQTNNPKLTIIRPILFRIICPLISRGILTRPQYKINMAMYLAKTKPGARMSSKTAPGAWVGMSILAPWHADALIATTVPARLYRPGGGENYAAHLALRPQMCHLHLFRREVARQSAFFDL